MRQALTILVAAVACWSLQACSKKEEPAQDAGSAKAEPVEETKKNPWQGLAPRELGKHDGAALHVGFSPDGGLLVSTGKDKTIKLWNPGTGQLVRELTGHTDKVMMADFSADGKLLVSASADQTARVWDVGSGKMLKTFQDNPPKKMTEEEELAYAQLPAAQMNWAAFTPDGTKVLTASDDFALKLWDVKTGKKLQTFRDDGCRQNRIYRRKDAAGWVSSAGCVDDGVSYMKFWDDAGNLVSVAGDEQRDAHYLAFDRAGRFIVAADGSLSFSVFSAQGSYLKRILVGGYHFCVVFGPDDKTLLVGNDRGEILVYRPGPWKREGVVTVGEPIGVDSLAVSPADGTLAVALRNGKILHFTSPIR